MKNDHDEQDQALPFPSFRIWLCGAFRVERRVGTNYEAVRTSEWGGSSYPRLLLKALLCCPGRQARREALVEMLWPDVDPEQAAQNLNTATTKLRSVLRPGKGQESLLLTEEDASRYRLEEQPVLWVDADAALALLKEAERTGRTGSEVLPFLEEATTCFNRGTFLGGEEGQWVCGRRATIERARYRGRLWLSEAYLQQEMPGQAEAVLSVLLEEDPTDEDVLSRLLALLHRQHMTHKALLLYAQTCNLLGKEGLEPGEATRALAKWIQEDRHSTPLISLDAVQIPPGRVTLQPTTREEQTLFLLSPSSAQKQVVVSGSMRSQSEIAPSTQAANGLIAPVFLSTNGRPLTEVASGDCATWFSERLTQIIAFVTQQRGQIRATDFEKLLDRELRVFDEIKMMFDPETYYLSRRSALLVIAAFPKGLLVLLQQQKTAFIKEEFLPACAASITACWYLLNGREFDSVERALARYMPFLVGWAQQESPYQRTAAYLASQAYLLLGFIELHRLQFQQRIVYCGEAVKYGREAREHPLLVKALTQLGNAYYDQGLYTKMLQAYQEARSFMKDVPCSLQSKVLMGLAHAYAQQGQAAEALDTISEARRVFPGEIEEVPAFLSADDGEYSLILFDGWIRLDLGKHYPDKDYHEQAAKALAQIDRLPTTALVPERYRHEIINRRAQAAIALGKLDAFRDLTLQSTEILQVMHSEKRRQELIINYKTALKKWPRESKVVELAEVVL